MVRYIGIQHRVKQTAEGEAHPTRVAIIDGDRLVAYELPTEQDELNFLLGTFGTKFKTVEYVGLKGETEKLKEPIEFDGLKRDDVAAMLLGGSGDYLAYALSRQAVVVGASVIRVPSFVLKSERLATDDSEVSGIERTLKSKPTKTKTKTADDHILLAHLARDKPQLFFPLAEKDAKLILTRENWRALWESMQARMACEQRLRQLYIGRAFTRPDGLFPEGGIEQGFDATKASDPILSALNKEEARRERELTASLEALEVYQKLFKPIEGVGPKIAGRIISAVIDIRRFETEAKLKAYMGVHVLPDGKFARRRHGQVANWHGDARQALYLLGDQFNRRPDSYWGQYLRKMKANLRRAHPEPVEVETPNGKVKRYTNGHIHKMATWRTLSRFVESLHHDWTRLEESRVKLPKAA